MDFSLQIMKQTILDEAEKGIHKNFACSPISITVLLSMITSGLKGKSLEKMLNLLGSKSMADLNTKALNLMGVASYKSSSVTEGPLITFVNGAWVDQRLSFKPSVEETLKNIYQAQVKALDFVNKPNKATRKVNLWVENATNGLIKEVVRKGTFDEDTMIFLANALYFKGAWKDEFEKSMTKEGKFYLLNGDYIKVPYMCEKSTCFDYGSSEDFKLLKLPYKYGKDEKRFSMYFFLPNKQDGLENLLQQFNSNSGFLSQHFELKREKIRNLMIPKFKISKDVNVSEIMGKLGLALPSLNLGELIQDSRVVDDALIFHKCRVEINEEGTEAAAITYAVMSRGGSRYTPPPIDFVADHPFIFMIKEDASGIPLFIGAILNPLLEE